MSPRPAAPQAGRLPLQLPAEIREAALAHTPRAIEVLAEVMNDVKTPPATRVMAADKIMDRALGKAPQQVDVKSEKRDLLEYTTLTLSLLRISVACRVAVSKARP